MIPPDKAATAALVWWRSLQPDGATPNRGALARLRRCASATETMQEPAALLLFRRVGGAGPWELPQVGVAAAVLAHVRTDSGAGALLAARQLGPDSLDTPETAILKPLRFRRLIEATEDDDRLTAFRRMVALAGGRLPVRDLAHGLLFWSDELKTRWIYHYWNVVRPPPRPRMPHHEPLPAASSADLLPARQHEPR